MDPPPQTGYLEFPAGPQTRIYADPVAIIVAHTVGEVAGALARVEARVGEGYQAAGYVAYEAAPAFDSVFQTHALHDLPLLWFGIYEAYRIEDTAVGVSGSVPEALNWRPDLDRASYDRAVGKIRERIAAGDSYQVNFTFPTSAHFTGGGLAWFRERQRAQQSAYSAYLDLGTHEILSLSPELFFALDGERVSSRPMKGTRPRGFSLVRDRQLADELYHSPKERAENLMIVDMLRNDLGRICATNSIRVPALFAIEQYPTVWQMTSTVTGQTAAGVPEIFRALFPCASVTGAPKIETMKIIRDLEERPRGVYCGAIGWWGPGRQAQFSVAIRTAVVDRRSGEAVYPVGSGITWDSVDAQEYEECRTKTAVLQHAVPDFSLITSLRLDEDGYFLLEAHLERLERSAAYFAYPFDRGAASEALQAYIASVAVRPAKVRVAVGRQGEISLTHDALPAPAPWRVGLALTPIDIDQPWVYHKTTQRACYDTARAARPDCNDVVLFNGAGFLTESTFANIVLETGGHWYTPELSQGLLDGVYRRHLLETGTIEERPLTLEDLDRAGQIHLINSVRQWIPVEWVPAPEAALEV